MELLLPRGAPAKAGSVVEDGNDMHDGGGEGYKVCAFWREVGDLMDCRPGDRWGGDISSLEELRNSG